MQQHLTGPWALTSQHSGLLAQPCRYHLGSIALGSLIVAAIQFIKYLLAYLDKHSKQWRNKAGPAGWVLKYLFKCLICCVWLLEKIMQFVNR